MAGVLDALLDSAQARAGRGRFKEYEHPRHRRGRSDGGQFRHKVGTAGIRPLPDTTPGIADSPGESARMIAWRLRVQRFDAPRPKASSGYRERGQQLNRRHVRIVGLAARLRSERQRNRPEAEGTARELRRELGKYTVGGGADTDAVKGARALVRRRKRIREEESVLDTLLGRAGG